MKIPSVVCRASLVYWLVVTGLASSWSQAAEPSAPSTDRPGIAVFAGPTATILNTDPPITSQKAREKYGLPRLRDWFGHDVMKDTLYPQRLAAPATVYIEQFSAHPLERDAAGLFAPPDGYLDADNAFHRERQSPADRPVYEVVLKPEDGLYPLPYMARRADGSAWTGFDGADGGVKQTFFPDASRAFEELERTASVMNANVSGRAALTFFRPAPPGGYTQGEPGKNPAAGEANGKPERAAVDYFPYGYSNTNPPRAVLARITNQVQAALATGKFRGALWLEGSPRVEDSLYWLNLVIDTDDMIAGTAAQRPNHRLSADGPQNLVEAVDFVLSEVWRDEAGHNRVGAVLVQDQQIFAAREVIKTAAKPGGYAVGGGHGGVIGTTAGPVITFIPNRKHGHDSAVNVNRLPATAKGLMRAADGKISQVAVPVKESNGDLRGEAIPHVELVDLNDWMTSGAAGGEKTISAETVMMAVDRCLAEAPLTGLVAESPQGGHYDAAEAAALERAALAGLPVVKVFRGATGGFVYPNPGNLLIEGSNLNGSKARVLLMACLLRFGTLPPAVDPLHPTANELTAIKARIAEYQAVFDTH